MMKRSSGLFLLVLLAVLSLMVPSALRADTVYLPLTARVFFDRPVTWATVRAIVDGDTVWVDVDGDGIQDVKVRYIGVDTPEIHFGTDCYGPEATARNRELVDGRLVALERDVSDTDRYDRLLRYIYLPDGTWVNGVLVGEGYAKAKRYAPDTRYAAALERLQEAARAERAGGWAACGW